MGQKLFITATNTNVGKTYASIKLLEHLGSKGLRVGAIKPIETGVNNIPQDAYKLLEISKKYNKNFASLEPKDICFYSFKLPAAPYVASNKEYIDIEQIKNKIKYFENLADFLIIEGAGGLFVPINKNYFMIDLIKDLNVDTLLVTPSNLGCINETLLSINALESRAINYNWCVNLYKDSAEFKKITQPFYDSYFNNWKSLDKFIKDLDIISF